MLNTHGLNALFFFAFMSLTDSKAFELERCSQFPCYNGGTCIELDIDQPYCQCPEHFMGPKCEIPANTTICKNLNCSAMQSCVFSRDQNKWMCLCDVSKYGRMCHKSSSIKTTRVLTTTIRPGKTSSFHEGVYIIVGSLIFTAAIVIKIGLLYYHFRVKPRRRILRVTTSSGGRTMHNKDTVLAKAPSYEEACSNTDSPPSYEETIASRPQK